MASAAKHSAVRFSTETLKVVDLLASRAEAMLHLNSNNRVAYACAAFRLRHQFRDISKSLWGTVPISSQAKWLDTVSDAAIVAGKNASIIESLAKQHAPDPDEVANVVVCGLDACERILTLCGWYGNSWVRQ